MSSQTTEIKDRVSIVDVVSSYLKIEQAGKNYKARCPFHNEKTASFFISPDRGSYYCFGCHAKGDIFSFVQEFEGIDFLGALKILADRAGVKLQYDKSYKIKDERERLYLIMEEATKYFEIIFQKEFEPMVYLKERGLTDDTIKSFRIGYAPAQWRSVSDYLIKKGFGQKELEKVGLIKKSNSGFYDRFRGRIIFPIFDSSGRVIAFSGRIFVLPNSEAKGATQEAKYLNSPDTTLFNKSNVLFGIDRAKNAIRTRGYSIIVEGQLDLILSHQAGFTNTVAVSGTALSDTTATSDLKINNLGLIKRLSSNVIFAYDGDEAGFRAANRSAMIALSLDMQVKIAVLPKGKDPADIIFEGVEKWEEVLKGKTDLIYFHINNINKETKDRKSRERRIREDIFPLLLKISNPIKVSSYITAIYQKTGLSEKAIVEDFKRFQKEKKEEVNKNEIVVNDKKNISRQDLLFNRLFGIFFWKINNLDIKNKINEILENISNLIGPEKFIDMKKTYESLEDTLSFESEMWYGGKDENLILKDIKEIALNLEEEILQEKLFIILDDLNKSDKNTHKEKLLDYQKIVEKIEEIKSRRKE